MHHGGMPTPHLILCVDLYFWVGEEEGYDGCVAFPSRQMQRGKVFLQRNRRADDEGRGARRFNKEEEGVREHRKRIGGLSW